MGKQRLAAGSHNKRTRLLFTNKTRLCDQKVPKSTKRRLNYVWLTMCPKSTQRKQDKTSKNTWLLCTLLHAQLERHHTKTCAPGLECIIDIRPSKVAPELHVPSTENAQYVDSLWLPVVYPLKMYLATCWVPRSCEVTIIIWVHKAGNSLYILIYVQFLSFHVLCLAFIYLYTFASFSFFPLSSKNSKIFIKMFFLINL